MSVRIGLNRKAGGLVLLVVVERGKKAKAATHPNLAKFPAKRKKTTRHEIFRTLL